MATSRTFLPKLVFGIFLVAFLIYKIGFGSFAEALSFTNIWMVNLLVASLFVNFLIAGTNFFILLRPFLPGLRILRLAYFYTISWSVGMFVPGRLGEFSLIYFFQRHGLLMGQGFAIVLLDKMITLFLSASIAMFAAFVLLPISDALTFFGLVIAVFSVIFFLLFSPAGRLLIKTLLRQRLSRHFKGFSKTLSLYFRKRQDLLFMNILMTLAKLIVMVTTNYLLFRLYGQEVAYYLVFLVSPLLLVTTLVPLTFAGLGLAEGLAVFLYSFHGINPAVVLAVQLLQRVVMYSLASLMALLNISTILELRQLFATFLGRAPQKS